MKLFIFSASHKQTKYSLILLQMYLCMIVHHIYQALALGLTYYINVSMRAYQMLLQYKNTLTRRV